VKQEKAELCKRESIEKFDKDQLKKTSTVEKNSLPDPQGLYLIARSVLSSPLIRSTLALALIKVLQKLTLISRFVSDIFVDNQRDHGNCRIQPLVVVVFTRDSCTARYC